MKLGKNTWLTWAFLCSSFATHAASLTENNEALPYFTAELNGEELDVLRLPAADNFDQTSNINYQTLTSKLTSSEWRFATFEELSDYGALFAGDVEQFLALNQQQWSPKPGSEEWNILIPGVVQDDSDTENVSWGLHVSPSGVGLVAHKHNFNISAKGAAALLVRTPGDGTGNTGCQVQSEVDLEQPIIYVDASADTCGNGSESAPFVDLANAQSLVREVKSQLNQAKTITVQIAPGKYELSEGFLFTSADSGSEGAPVVYQGSSAGDVLFFGGKVLDAEKFVAAAEHPRLAQLVDKTKLSNILQYDLLSDGVRLSDLGELAPHGFALEPNNRVPSAMLYSGTEKMNLARWPNVDQGIEYLDQRAIDAGHKGMVSYLEVIDQGPTVAGIDRFNDVDFNTKGGTFSVAFDRFKHWSDITNVFLDGILGRSWEWTYNQLRLVDVEQQHITLKRGEISGIDANKSSYFFFENVPEEIDEPGEFYLDRDEGTLLFYPKKPLEQVDTVVATLSAPMFKVSGAKYLVFDGITLDSGRHLGFEVSNSEHIRIQNCTVRNFTLGAIAIDGQSNLVDNCHVENIGGYGVKVSGGKQASLYKEGGASDFNRLRTPVELEGANNTVSNNLIHNFAWDQKSQVPGVWLQGVGNTVSYNEIYDAPHFAILLRSSTDNKVLHNYLHDLPTYHKFDGGALYVGTGRFPHYRGNEVRGNLFVDVPTNGVYIDNFSSGVLVEDNIFSNVGFMEERWPYNGVNINGGGHNLIKHNLFLDNKLPIKANRHAENNAFENYYSAMKGIFDAFNLVGVNNTPYNKYPDFLDFLSFTEESQFQFMENTIDSNMMLNPEVPVNSDFEETGIQEPQDKRWLLDGNVMANENKYQRQDIKAFIQNLNEINGSSSWRSDLTSLVQTLPSIYQALTAAVDESPEMVVSASGSVLANTVQTMEIQLLDTQTSADITGAYDISVQQLSGSTIVIEKAEGQQWTLQVPDVTQAEIIELKVVAVKENSQLEQIISISIEVNVTSGELQSVVIEGPEEVNSGQDIYLSASVAHTFDDPELDYVWEQIEGPELMSSAGDNDSVTFSGLSVEQDTSISIKLTVSYQQQQTSYVQNITIKGAESVQPTTEQSAGGSWSYSWLLLSFVLIKRLFMNRRKLFYRGIPIF